MKTLITPIVSLIFSYTVYAGLSPDGTTEMKSWIRTTDQEMILEFDRFPIPKNTRFHVSIYQEPDQPLFDDYVKPESHQGILLIRIGNLQPKLWNPASPELYKLVLKLEKGSKVFLENNYRIGFRKIHSDNGQIFLNGKPVFLRGIAINPPGRGIPADIENSREFAVEYVRFMKSINVNIIRIPDSEVWYDVCDELGMMVFGGNYSASVNREKPPEDYDSGVTWYKNTKFQPIMHHPSLVIYALTNEVPFRGEISVKWIDFLSYAHEQLKKWDGTRLYIGNAGYGYGQSGDICDLHRYWGWYYSSPYTFLHIRDYDSITFPDKVQPLTFTECVGNYTGPDGRYNLTPNHKNPVSQLNWTGHAPQYVQQLLADEHQSWVLKEATELFRRLRRINPEASGIFPFTILFRNWHTARNLVDMDPKPATRQVRISYQPVLLSWENWKSQVYAGTTIEPIAHLINDSEYYEDLVNNLLVVRLLDKTSTVIAVDTLTVPDLPYYDIHSERVKLSIPADLFSGDFILEGILISSGKEVSRNADKLYISGQRPMVNAPAEIPVYDPEGKTIESLRSLGFNIHILTPEDISAQLDLLVIGANSADAQLQTKRSVLGEMVNSGGRILVLDQDPGHQDYLSDLLPVQLIFPSMDLDDPSYPPPARPSRNAFNINPERPDHPVFHGINRNRLKMWSDYSEWDETKSGFPAIYPVKNGFTLLNKEDRGSVAILANYSVGLEGIALAEMFEGQGSVIVSGFDLVNRRGLDPVADRLLANLVEYCLIENGHVLHPLVEAPILWGEYETEKGILDGITSGFMLNSKPNLFGSYENLRILLEEEGHMYAGARGGWNNRAGKQYLPYGRRIFGPYFHRGFGGVPTPIDQSSNIGKAFFWCRVPENRQSMQTLVWNPASVRLEVKIGINGTAGASQTIAPGAYRWIRSALPGNVSVLHVEFEGDRRLVVLETNFE